MRRVPSKLGEVWMQMPGRVKLQILESSNCKYRCHRIQSPTRTIKGDTGLELGCFMILQKKHLRKKMCLKHLLTSRSASSERDLRSFLKNLHQLQQAQTSKNQPTQALSNMWWSMRYCPELPPPLSSSMDPMVAISSVQKIQTFQGFRWTTGDHIQSSWKTAPFFIVPWKEDTGVFCKGKNVFSIQPFKLEEA